MKRVIRSYVIKSAILFLACFLMSSFNAYAVTLTATSVSENFTPSLNGGTACSNNVSIVADGLERVNASTTRGYCPLTPVPSNYEVTYTWSPTPELLMTSLTVWANAGGIFGDGELQSFDLEVDYIDAFGSPATLLMPGVNIGNTANINDPKTVTLIDGGVPVALAGVSDVRISNLGGVGFEVPWREIFGEFQSTNIDFVTVKSITAGAGFPAVGDTVTFEITITNNDTDEAEQAVLVDLLPAGLTPTVNNGSVTAGTYNSGDGTWTVPILAGGASETLTLEGVVNAGQQGNIITNSTTAADNFINDETNTAGDVLTASIEVADPQFSITKTANQTTNVPVGTTITYTYRVTNNGNVPISNINLSDVHNGFGAPPVPANPILITDTAPTGDSTDISGDNVWDTLSPNDVVEFQGAYVVQQSDIDNLQ